MAFDANSLAMSLIFVRIGVAIDTADRREDFGNGTVGLLRTNSFVCESLIVNALQLAAILVGKSIGGTSRLIKIRALDKLAIKLAIAIVININGIAGSHAFVAIGFTINSTNWLVDLGADAVGLWFTSSIVSELFLVLTDQRTFVAIGKPIFGTNGVVSFKTRLPLFAILLDLVFTRSIKIFFI